MQLDPFVDCDFHASLGVAIFVTFIQSIAASAYNCIHLSSGIECNFSDAQYHVKSETFTTHQLETRACTTELWLIDYRSQQTHNVSMAGLLAQRPLPITYNS